MRKINLVATRRNSARWIYCLFWNSLVMTNDLDNINQKQRVFIPFFQQEVSQIYQTKYFSPAARRHNQTCQLLLTENCSAIVATFTARITQISPKLWVVTHSEEKTQAFPSAEGGKL